MSLCRGHDLFLKKGRQAKRWAAIHCKRTTSAVELVNSILAGCYTILSLGFFFLSEQEAKQLHTVIYIALTFLIIGAVCLCFDMWSISSHTSLPVTWVIGVGRGTQLSASLRCSPSRMSSVFSLCSSTGSTKALAMLWKRGKIAISSFPQQYIGLTMQISIPNKLQLELTEFLLT